MLYPGNISSSSLCLREWQWAYATSRNPTSPPPPGQMNGYLVLGSHIAASRASLIGSGMAWFTVSGLTMPGASRTVHCASVVLWRMLQTCWMLSVFVLGSSVVCPSWTLLVPKPMVGSRLLSCFCCCCLFYCFFKPCLACLAHKQIAICYVEICKSRCSSYIPWRSWKHCMSCWDRSAVYCLQYRALMTCHNPTSYLFQFMKLTPPPDNAHCGQMMLTPV